MGISIAFDTRTYHKKVARELHMKPSARNNFGKTGLSRRVRFRSCGTMGYGPPMWVKSRKALKFCTVMIARQVRG